MRFRTTSETRARIETARHQVLRLLGEASTLRISSRRSMSTGAIERDASRSRKEEESAPRLSALEQIKAELSSKLTARHLSSIVGRSRRRSKRR